MELTVKRDNYPDMSNVTDYWSGSRKSLCLVSYEMAPVMVFSNRPGPFVARMENWNRRCPASTIVADSCCLIEKCYRKIST